MTTSLFRRAMAGGGLAILATVGLAGPAFADATVRVTPQGVSQLPGTNKATVDVSVNLDSGTTVVGKVRLRVQQVGSKRPDITAESDAPASFEVPVPYNGTYRATADADWKHTVLLGSHSGKATSAPVDFLVAVLPDAPADVKAVVDPDSRAVTVTWKANTEPDILFYLVQRARGATSTDFTVLGKATSPRFVDSTTTETGGDYRYQVFAVRNGATADEGLSSDPSALSTAKVPDPPPPPTTVPAPTVPGATAATGAGAGAAGPASSVPANSPGALTSSGAVDLSGFNTVRTQTRSVTPRTLPQPDTGFQSTLPFITPPATTEDAMVEEGGDLGELAVDSPQYRELGDGSSASDRFRTMAFFAAGLLATVLLMHVLWVRSEVHRLPLEAVDPEGPLPVAGRGEATQAKAKGAKRRRGRAGSGPDKAADPTWEDVEADDFAPIVVASNAKGNGGNRRQKVSTRA